MADVVCVGIACTDVLIRGVDLTTPFKEESKRCEDTLLAVGGDAINEAIVMARMGVDVKLLVGVGDDAIADFIEKTAENAGVDVSAVNHTENSESLMNIVVIHPDGQRNFINTGRNPESAYFEPDLEALKGAKIVSLGSMMIPPFNTAERISRVLKAAKENGSIVCADVIYNPTTCSLEDLKDVLCNIDYIFPNEDEARGLTQSTDLDEMANVFLKYGVKNVIIKIGKDGCFVKNANERLFMPCIGPKAIDTTGAGDNFAAGFITALNDGKSLSECCLFAAATAGLACQYIGANTGVKSKEQVEEFLKEYMPDGGNAK